MTNLVKQKNTGSHAPSRCSVTRSLPRKLSRILFNVLLVVFVIFTFLCCDSVLRTASTGEPSLFGLRAEYILSGSMVPTYDIGDVIIIQNATNYQINDIVTYESNDGSLVSHRIVNEQEDGTFTLKGDANNASDTQAVTNDEILGKVILIIPQGSRIIEVIKSPFFIGVTVFVLTVVLLAPLMRKRKTIS